MQYQIAASPASEKEMVIALVSGNRAEESISCHNDRIGNTRRKMGKRGVMAVSYTHLTLPTNSRV